MISTLILTSLTAFVSIINAFTIYVPPSTSLKPGVSYPRAIRLANGDLVVTFEYYPPTNPYFPIFYSIDQGHNWFEKSRVYDKFGDGLRYHPGLVQLTETVGEYPSGSVVIFGTSVTPSGTGTNLVAYVSTNNCQTWQYASTVATGGVPQELAGYTAVWHPFPIIYHGQLLLYFSDQRDSRYSCKIVLTTTLDLRTWNRPTEQVVSSNYADRPTIATVAQVNNKWVMAYEFGNVNINYGVYFRTADVPYGFLNAEATLLRDNTNNPAIGAPYIAWANSSDIHPYGTTIIGSSDRKELLINRNEDIKNTPWQTLYNIAPPGYTRALVPLDSERLLIAGAGALGTNSSDPNARNVVDVTVIYLEEIYGVNSGNTDATYGAKYGDTGNTRTIASNTAGTVKGTAEEAGGKTATSSSTGIHKVKRASVWKA